ncbi:orotate phosphoribosyltransferase [Acaryochloris sp. IP29b_bin.148]|uniref:orotate phosphoribosyltransferase n=1 Tax=Acaryochloris sp. IP29b_bin.148 TaxID=2969218 RepID=UPI002608D998|nr:orotate phosphoribosyltransferase [Acaryochloris sp. IP29b_bin.148]
MNKADLAQAIYETSHITGEFRLRSGQMSHEYFDKYLFEADPVLLNAITEHLVAMIPQPVDALAGLEMGGIPIVAMLSQLSHIPSLFVRKQAKPYGTCKLAEGGEIAGKRLVIIEDVVTSGGQIKLSAQDLRALGATVTDVMCVIDREAGGRASLEADGLQLHPLFTMSELKQSVG